MTVKEVIKKTQAESGAVILGVDKSINNSVSKRLIYIPSIGYELRVRDRVKGVKYRLWSSNPVPVLKKYDEVEVVEV